MVKSLVSMTLIVLLFGFGCKSDVEEKHSAQQSPVQVDSLTLHQTSNIRESIAAQALIESKNYVVKACLSEATLGDTLRLQKVELEGGKLVNNQTDNNGCVFWEHNIDHTVKTGKRCEFFTATLKLPGAGFEKTLEYSIDVMDDALLDHSVGQSCQELTNQRKEEQKQLAQSSDSNIFLDEINLSWTNNIGIQRSDRRYLTHQTEVRSCLRSSYTNEPVSNTKLKLTIKNLELDIETEEVVMAETNPNGCFKSFFKTYYKQFLYSHWAMHKIKVEVLSGMLKGSEVTNNVGINSWEKGLSNFGIDPRFNETPENHHQSNNQFFIDNVMYIQIGNDLKSFHVNDKMGLTVAHSYQVVLNPKINRGHIFGASSNPYSIPLDGKFKLKFMILAPQKPDIEITRDNYEDFDFITGASKIVELRNGVINEVITIPVRMTDLPRIATRTVAILKIEPMDEVVDLNPSVVTGFFKSKISWIRTNVLQSADLSALPKSVNEKIKKISSIDTGLSSKLFEKDSIQNFSKDLVNKVSSIKIPQMTQEQKDTINSLSYKASIERLFENLDEEITHKMQDSSEIIKEKSSDELFFTKLQKDYENIEMYFPLREADSIEDESESELVYTNEELDSFTEKLKFKKARNSHSLIKRLCQREDLSKGDMKKCKKNPTKFFDIIKYRHSLKVTRTIPRSSHGFHIGLSTSFSTGQSYSESTSFSYGAELKAPDIPGLDLFGASASLSHSRSRTRSESQSDDTSTSHNIAVEQFNIDVEGDFRDCYLVTGKTYSNNMHMCLGASKFGKSALRFCAENLASVKKTESQYYLCGTEKTMKVSEPWYFIESYSSTSNLFRDSFGPTEGKLLKVLRGKYQFNKLRELFEDNTRNYVINRTSGEDSAVDKIFEKWGYIVDEDVEPKAFNKLILRDFQAGFPGTMMQEKYTTRDWYRDSTHNIPKLFNGFDNDPRPNF